MSAIRPIFWSQLDSCIRQFPLANRPLQAISREYPVCFACSGGQGFTDELKTAYPMASFLECRKNSNSMKARAMFESLKKNDRYDVLVRTCCDSVITDVRLLLSILEESLSGRHAIIGHMAYRGRKMEWPYVWGGCNAVSRSVVDRIDMPEGGSNNMYDGYFSDAVRRTGASIIDRDLFCWGPPAQPGFPVCHPAREISDRWGAFLKILEGSGGT